MKQSSLLVAGADEVGRGCLAGPVVAAAVILPESFYLPGLTDSKLLIAKKRELLALEIKQQAIAWHIASATVEEINQINILEASKLAIMRAINGLCISPYQVLIDGNMKFPALEHKHESLIQGDLLVPSISAASVIAKVHRDRIMEELAEIHPGYGWEKNAGYGTKQHLAALSSLGVTMHHRATFAPVAAAIKNTAAIPCYTQ